MKLKIVQIIIQITQNSYLDPPPPPYDFVNVMLHQLYLLHNILDYTDKWGKFFKNTA